MNTLTRKSEIFKGKTNKEVAEILSEMFEGLTLDSEDMEDVMDNGREDFNVYTSFEDFVNEGGFDTFEEAKEYIEDYHKYFATSDNKENQILIIEFF